MISELLGQKHAAAGALEVAVENVQSEPDGAHGLTFARSRLKVHRRPIRNRPPQISAAPRYGKPRRIRRPPGANAAAGFAAAGCWSARSTRDAAPRPEIRCAAPARPRS